MAMKRCKHCNELIDTRGLWSHEHKCGAQTTKNSSKKTCEYCGDSYSSRGMSAHREACRKRHEGEQEHTPCIILIPAHIIVI